MAVRIVASPVEHVRIRDVGLDAFRGLAVLLMIGDHVAFLFGFDGYRLTFGRLAMPMFFLLAGHLAGRLRWRHAGIAGLGVLLPLAVPWIDSPNVLVWWALGCAVIAGGRAIARRGGFFLLMQVLAAAGLVVAANGWEVPGHTYQPLALLGLMALGTSWPRWWFTWAGSLPAWVAAIGRHPVAWYVGHLLVLEGVVLWLLSV